MRLIDADDVIQTLKETGIIQDNDLGHLVVDEINRIPTAYDVLRVVAELEEWTYKADVIMPRGDIVKNVKLISSGSAIDIVRKGGAE